MLIATGTILVLVTWALAVAIVVALGAVPALLSERGPVSWRTAARSLWWGLLIAAVLAMLASALWPLRSTQVSILLATLALAGGLGAVAGIRRRGWNGRAAWSIPAAVVAVAMGVSLLVFAVAAVGPVTNYDTGLYHYGAIRYAMEFPAIPGLANLYAPLGYGNAGFPLAAVLGNGPLGFEGYRALNGAVIALAALDLVTRVVRQRWSAGTYVLLVGLTASITPMLTLADYWVTSPSQDSAVLFVTVVAAAYLTDAASGKRRWLPDAAVALVLSLLLVLLRPTMLGYAAAVLLVVVVIAWVSSHRAGQPWRSTSVALGVMGGLTGAAILVRDVILSGWLLYPLSILPFDVEWQAGDPTGLREATLGFWRNREDIWGSVEGWTWVGPWLATLPGQWETYLLGAVVAGAVLGGILAATTGPLRWRRLALAMVPSMVAAGVWWLATPPGFRFAWGPLISLGTIPIGWALWRLAVNRRAATDRIRPLVTVASLALISVTCAYTVSSQIDWDAMTARGQVDLGPFSVEYAYAPVPVPPTSTLTTDSGLEVRVPTKSDQCWAVFPMCSPTPPATLAPLGPFLQDGLAS